MSTLRMTASRLRFKTLLLFALLLMLGLPLLQAEDNAESSAVTLLDAQSKPEILQQATTNPTVDAAVATIFAQTQQASSADMTAVVATAFSAAQTATAEGAEPATEEATPEVTAEPTIDVSTLSAEVVETFDLPAGPANTSAYLAPDGDKFVYINVDEEICLYSLAGLEQHCTRFDEETRRMDRESVAWSPDGRYVAFALQAFIYLIDSDIWVYDTVDNTLTNITPDEMTDLDIAALDTDELTIDVSPRWTDDGRLWHLRIDSSNTGSVISTNLSGDDVSEVYRFTTQAAFQYYLMDVRPDSSAFALAGYSTGDGDQSVYYQNLAEETSRTILLTDDFGVSMLTFSPDGQYLLLLDGRVLGEFSMQRGAMSVLDVTTSRLRPVDSGRLTMAAGWLPGQNSLIYSVFDVELDNIGLYIAQTPGEPGEQILNTRYFPTTSRNTQPFWISTQNTFLASQEGSFLLSIIALR